MVSFWWICRYRGYGGEPASHIFLSQRLDPKEKQVINLDQDVQVCGYFLWMVDELLYMISLSLSNIFGTGYIFFSLFFFLPCLGDMWHTFFGYASFFLTCLVGMWHAFLGYAYFYFFLFSPNFLTITLERDSHGMSWSFICGWMGGYTCYLPV
jgi:hypothetical protein